MILVQETNRNHQYYAGKGDENQTSQDMLEEMYLFLLGLRIWTMTSAIH
jgi:hypothetical protein